MKTGMKAVSLYNDLELRICNMKTTGKPIWQTPNVELLEEIAHLCCEMPIMPENCPVFTKILEKARDDILALEWDPKEDK